MKADVEAALARLETLLAEKEAEVEDLRREISERDYEQAWRWTAHRMVSADPSPTLPVPRLEIRYQPLPGDPDYNCRALYCLVYRHLTARAVPGSADCIIFVPLGETRSTGPRGLEPREHEGRWAGRSYGPFRDGAHIRQEMRTLNLPGFVIGASGDTYQIDLDAEARLNADAQRGPA